MIRIFKIVEKKYPEPLSKDEEFLFVDDKGKHKRVSSGAQMKYHLKKLNNLEGVMFIFPSYDMIFVLNKDQSYYCRTLTEKEKLEFWSGLDVIGS